jgi:hypothetical protein
MVWQVDPGLELGWVEEKIGEEKTRRTRRVDPARPDQKTRLRSVHFFLLKQHRFDFFKKKRIDLGDSVTRSKPGIQILDWAGYRTWSENYDQESY